MALGLRGLRRENSEWYFKQLLRDKQQKQEVWESWSFWAHLYTCCTIRPFTLEVLKTDKLFPSHVAGDPVKLLCSESNPSRFTLDPILFALTSNNSCPGPLTEPISQSFYVGLFSLGSEPETLVLGTQHVLCQ